MPLNIKEVRSKPNKTTEDRIILAVASNYGIIKVSELCKYGFLRKDILLHARKSSFLLYEKEYGTIKLVKEGIRHVSILDNWKDAESIQGMVMSLLWQDFSLSKEEVVYLIEPRCNKLGLDLTNFKESNSNWSWYRKVVRKNANDLGHELNE